MLWNLPARCSGASAGPPPVAVPMRGPEARAARPDRALSLLHLPRLLDPTSRLQVLESVPMPMLAAQARRLHPARILRSTLQLVAMSLALLAVQAGPGRRARRLRPVRYRSVLQAPCHCCLPWRLRRWFLQRQTVPCPSPCPASESRRRERNSHRSALHRAGRRSAAMRLPAPAGMQRVPAVMPQWANWS